MISVFGAVRDLVRLREISAVLVRHGFGEFVSRAGFARKKTKKSDASQLASLRPPAFAPLAGTPSEHDELAVIAPEDEHLGEAERHRITLAERIRLVLEDLGPSFIKLGQIASTRADVLPPDLLVELKKLQDEVPAVPYEAIREQVESSLGATLQDTFVHFDETPLATASIGQVHRAVLTVQGEDTDVVVKVQRPNVADTVARDLDLLHILARALEKTIPETRVYSPIALVEQFDRSIMSELDFRVEADNAERFASNFTGSDLVRFPKVYRQAATKVVLALEFFRGVKIDEAVAAGHDGKLIAKRAVGVVIKMIFEDGFFHADPHPGNLFVLGTIEQPVLGVIDLGMVGRLSPELRDRTVDLMVAAVRKDSYAVADALYAIGRPKSKVDMRVFRAEVSTQAEKYLGKPLGEIQLSSLVRDLVQSALKFDVEIPSDFMLVGKALMTIEGIGRQLDPELDVLSEAQPYFLALLKDRYSPARLGNDLLRGATQLSRAGYDLPMQLREVLDDLRLGRLAIQTPDPALPAAIDRLGRRAFTAAVVATCIGSGALVVNGAHPVIGIILLVFAPLVWIGHALLDLRRK